MTMVDDKIKTDTGVVNIHGVGTVHWVKPGYRLWDAMFGKEHPDWDNMLLWCAETFDKEQWLTSSAPNRKGQLLFRRKEDLTVFMLKWC